MLDISNAPPRMTRPQLLEFLRAHGYPISRTYFNQLCLPSVGAGPPVAGYFCERALYEPAEALAWAEARIKKQRAERRVQAKSEAA